MEEVIAGLRFLGAHQRSAVKRQAVEDLQRYLSTNRARMRYRTFRDAGFQIGSGTAGLRHLDLLGGELARCSGTGIRVIVISLPQNPAVRHDCTAADRLLAGWAARHHLELDRYWNSGLVPTTHFVDTEHFDGDGADIVAAVLAGRILGGPQP